MTKRAWTRVFLVGAILTSAIISVSQVSACGNEVERVRDPRVDALLLADRLLLQTDNAGAVKIVDRHFPRLRNRSTVHGVLQLRAARILALVTVRSDGAWYVGGQLVVGSEKERAANLAWGVRQLERRAHLYPHSTSPQADLGEAMAQVPSERLRARFLLEKMDKDDRLRSPFALAALAVLREVDGDLEGAKKARKKCVHRTRNAAVCKAPSKDSQPST